MDDCTVCGGTVFYKEAGYFFCNECQTQLQDKREEILELRLEGTRITKRKISTINTSEKTGQVDQWTTWEQYNFVLIGLTDELIELGATSDLKLTALQLWAFYLGKAEVAFTSTVRKEIPKLARNYHKRDADIIYGKLRSRKRKRSRAASSSSIVSSYTSGMNSSRELNRRKRLMINAEYDRFVSSQTGSESDAVSLVSQSLQSVRSSGSRSSASITKLKYSKHAKEETKKVKRLSKKLPYSERPKYQQRHVTTKYRTGPHVITPMKLWAILYLALRIHNQRIHLADMLRFGREGHLSYYRLDHLLPTEMTLTDSDVKLLTQNNEITHKGMRRISAEIAKFLFVNEINCPDLIPLIERYCKDLNLPRGISMYAERLVAISPPNMKFNKLEPLIPNYEGRAMAFIIVVLKVLLRIDGITEYEISRVAEKVNRRLGNCCVIVHGGCGQCSDLVVCEKLDGCKKAASLGYKNIMNGGNALDAVEAALWWLECDEYFNCGYGSVLNQLGEAQMDASIMDGSRSEIGSVAAVLDVEHPISLARFILENYPNTIMIGKGARNLLRCAKMDQISKGNMVSPRALLALNLCKDCDPELRYNVEDLQNADLLNKSWGTAGCVAWDGCSMAAGTTTGGLSGKMDGRVGDSPLLGCGTFANNLAGCSLTGHGESIAKFGLSRGIVEEVTEGCCPEDALKSNIDSMHRKTNHESGGIVLKKSGCWGAHFTTPRMPYAVVKKGLITFGAKPGEKIVEKYFDTDSKKAKSRDDSHSKLFSFREWQRHIECRRNILMCKHFPTRFKNDSDAFGDGEVYVKFIKSALSRREEKVEITNYKNALPRNLTDAMGRCVTMLGERSKNSEDVEIFSPSLTPQHSYLNHLLDHPMYDLPDILRNNYSEAKVYYLTKPNKVIKFAAELGIALEIADSGLHFLNKLVPQFERSKMPSLAEWNTTVTVRSSANEKKKYDNRNDEFADHMEKKYPEKFELNRVKQLFHDAIQNKLAAEHSEHKNREENKSTECIELRKSDGNKIDFGFENFTAEGKLLIPDTNYSDSDSDSPIGNGMDNSTNEIKEMTFNEKYNFQLPNYFESNASNGTNERIELAQDASVSPNGNVETIRRFRQRISNTKSPKSPNLTRDSLGRFVREDSIKARVEPAVYRSARKPKPLSEKDSRGSTNAGANDSSFENEESRFIEVSGILKDDDVESSEKLFVSCTDYWMYHCVFSHIKSKDFEYFETELPVSFQWLLNECADVVEMSTEDLYEQVCLVETYFAHILKPENLKQHSYDSKDNQTKIRQCKRRW